MTRAKNLLTITYWGKGGSRFLAEMNPLLYEWEGSPLEPVKIPPIVPGKVSQPAVPSVSKTVSNNSESVSSSAQEKEMLTDFLIRKGLEIIDKRGNGGALWAVGDKSIEPILKETRKLFGALWTFSEKGGYATKHRSGWFTKSTK